MKVGTGQIMDSTISGAPSTNKYNEGKRDPEMHETRNN